MIYVLGVSGKKRSGKDTVYETIANDLRNLGDLPGQPKHVVRIAYADFLKRECAQYVLEPVFGISYEESLKEEYRDMLRPLWCVWGTELRQKLSGVDYWTQQMTKFLEELDAKYKQTSCLVVITDVRFKHEKKHIESLWFTHCLWRVTRPSLRPRDAEHVSETDLDDVEWDTEIYNDGTLQEFKTRIQLEYIRICAEFARQENLITLPNGRYDA